MNIKYFLGLLIFILLACKQTEEDQDIRPGQTPVSLDYPSYFGTPVGSLHQNLTKEGIELGSMLFYDTDLSKDHTVSCATCHIQNHAFTDNQSVSTGIKGRQGSRNAMSLSNLAWQEDFFWEGRAASLEEQALHPIEDSLEMGLSLDEAVQRLNASGTYPSKFKAAYDDDAITPERIANAIAQFELSLVSQNSKYDRYRRGDVSLTDQELKGLNLFYTHPEPSQGLRGGNCSDCHSGALQTDNDFHNNGLDQNPDSGRMKVTGSAADRGRFKTPSLRNIALTAPYMHDGRFETLEAVLDHYNEHIQQSATLDPLIMEASNEINGSSLALTDEEKQAIIAFLHTLTDTSFTENPDFSNPFN